MDAGLRQDGGTSVDGTLRLEGALDRAAVARLWPRLRALAAVSRIDLSAVEAVDSAGVALLVELRARWPQATLVGQPSGLAELRGAYRLDDGLGFAA